MGARKGGGGMSRRLPPPLKKKLSVWEGFFSCGEPFWAYHPPPPYKKFLWAHITVNNSIKVTGCWVKFHRSNHASSVNASSTGYTHKTT